MPLFIVALWTCGSGLNLCNALWVEPKLRASPLGWHVDCMTERVCDCCEVILSCAPIQLCPSLASAAANKQWLVGVLCQCRNWNVFGWVLIFLWIFFFFFPVVVDLLPKFSLSDILCSVTTGAFVKLPFEIHINVKLASFSCHGRAGSLMGLTVVLKKVVSSFFLPSLRLCLKKKK